MAPMDAVKIPIQALLPDCTAWKAGAGEGNRTPVVSLEGFCSTIELHPRGAVSPCKPLRPTMGLEFNSSLLAVSYSFNAVFPSGRNRPCFDSPSSGITKTGWWRGLDSNQRRHTPTGLQPVPFSHSGTPPGSRVSFLRGTTVNLSDRHAGRTVGIRGIATGCQRQNTVK